MFPGNPLYHYVILSTHATLRDRHSFHTHPYPRDEVWPHLNPNDPRCLAAADMTLVFE